MTEPTPLPAPPSRRVCIPEHHLQRTDHAWLRDVLALDVRRTLGRAAWRPQALCIAVHEFRERVLLFGPIGWPTVNEIADQLEWAPTLVLRHLDIAHAAGLLSVMETTR